MNWDGKVKLAHCLISRIGYVCVCDVWLYCVILSVLIFFFQKMCLQMLLALHQKMCKTEFMHNTSYWEKKVRKALVDFHHLWKQKMEGESFLLFGCLLFSYFFFHVTESKAELARITEEWNEATPAQRKKNGLGIQVIFVFCVCNVCISCLLRCVVVLIFFFF